MPLLFSHSCCGAKALAEHFQTGKGSFQQRGTPLHFLLLRGRAQQRCFGRACVVRCSTAGRRRRGSSCTAIVLNFAIGRVKQGRPLWRSRCCGFRGWQLLFLEALVLGGSHARVTGQGPQALFRPLRVGNRPRERVAPVPVLGAAAREQFRQAHPCQRQRNIPAPAAPAAAGPHPPAQHEAGGGQSFDDANGPSVLVLAEQGNLDHLVQTHRLGEFGGFVAKGLRGLMFVLGDFRAVDSCAATITNVEIVE